MHFLMKNKSIILIKRRSMRVKEHHYIKHWLKELVIELIMRPITGGLNNAYIIGWIINKRLWVSSKTCLFATQIIEIRVIKYSFTLTVSIGN